MSIAALKNRITGHVKVPASSLKPHPLNPRTHGDSQRSILRALLEEIGLARSVLAYVADQDKGLEDPPLTLIDGHLRQEELGEELVDVEVLNVNDEEARKLLLSLDPLAALAGQDDDRREELRRVVEGDSPAVAALWAALDAGAARVREALKEAQDGSTKLKAGETLAEQFYVLIECDSEDEQVRLLERFQAEGLRCSARMA